MIPWLSLIALFACAEIRWHWATAFAYVLVGFAAYLHHNHLVNRADLIGRWSDRERAERAIADIWRNQVHAAMMQVDRNDPAVYPAGWASELPFWQRRGAPLLEENRGGHSLRIEPLWHSPITGIYHLRRIPLRAWYPGGRLADAADKVELRERS